MRVLPPDGLGARPGRGVWCTCADSGEDVVVLAGEVVVGGAGVEVGPGEDLVAGAFAVSVPGGIDARGLEGLGPPVG